MSYNKERHSARFVTYLGPKHSKLLEAECQDREEKPAVILREIIKEYFERNPPRFFPVDVKK